MNFFITGVSHKTLPIELCERLYIPLEQRASFVKRLLAFPGVHECLALSTCNRTELHVVSSSTDIIPALQQVLCGVCGVEPDIVNPCWYVFDGDDAVRHLFRLVAGLDSLVVGETQIFNQVKEAYKLAYDVGATGMLINPLMHRAFFVAKRIRTETGIGVGSLSLSSIAVELIEATVCSRTPLTLLVIGAGKVATSAAKSFVDRGFGNLLIANRTWEKAQILSAQLSAQAVRWEEVESHLLLADAVISCSGSMTPILTRELLAPLATARAEKPLMIVDLGVPRDVDPQVRNLTNIVLHNVDDLKGIADRNHAARKVEAIRAEKIVMQNVKEYSMRRPHQKQGGEHDRINDSDVGL